MNDQLLHIVATIRERLNQPKYDQGVLAGKLTVDQSSFDQLVQLSAAGIIEDTVVAAGRTFSLAQLQLPVNIAVTLYTKQLPGAIYYETLAEFVKANLGNLPPQPFYIADKAYFSTQDNAVTEMSQYADVIRLVTILSGLADYIQQVFGKNKTLIFFQKKKLNLPLIFDSSQLRHIPYLDKLETQFNEAHDKEERKTIFKTELVSSLQDVPEDEVFCRLLSTLDQIYEHYLQSHLLYLDKFSYQDLKSAVDKDQLEYTKKIYNTVNDIQNKLIAVPAAFLLIFAQFDFSGLQLFKNILILVGAVLFAILIDVLLRNQFGVLRYIRSEIDHVKSTLQNKDTQVDLSVFITSFADLDPIMLRQRNYLWFFRTIAWLVPAVTLIMLFVFNHATAPIK